MKPSSPRRGRGVLLDLLEGGVEQTFQIAEPTARSAPVDDHYAVIDDTGLREGIRDRLRAAQAAPGEPVCRPVLLRGLPAVVPPPQGRRIVLTVIVSHWRCLRCDVEERDPEPSPSCWSCGRDVVVTARPSCPSEPPGTT
jgi:hypothetical protein